MRKSIACFLFLALCFRIHGQEEQLKKSTVTVGVGSSVVGVLGKLLLTQIDKVQKDKFSFKTTSPVYCVSYDYKLKKWFSLGGSYSSQSFSASFNNYTYKSPITSDTVTESFRINMKRSNIALRPIFYLPLDDDRHNMYLGARIGLTTWNISSKAIYGYTISRGFASPFNFQCFMGYRYSFSNIAGIYAELAAGPTYFAMTGINVKF